MPKPGITLVHLSDIHFRDRETGDLHDANRNLRNELELDLSRMRAHLGKVDGIIVSGDIAYAGKPAEYEYASSWLQRISELLECSMDDVMVTPGNHDIDRQLAGKREALALQRTIRDGNRIDLNDAALAQALRDQDKASLLMEPMEAYNKFARAFNCDVSPEKPYWERDFRFGNEIILRMRGITTTLISGPKDSATTGKMLYGSAQRTLQRIETTYYALVGHHPPGWALDGSEAERFISLRSLLHMFGHVHDQWIDKVGNSVRLISGAVQPSRDEPRWLPRYAIITISVISRTKLKLRIYPRRWSDEEICFIGDFNSHGRDYRNFTIDLKGFQN